MLTPEELRSLDRHERATLMRALAALDAEDPLRDPHNIRRRRFFLLLLAGCCVWLVPWTVFLAVTLPRHYTAEHWPEAWTGFDVALLSSIAATLWTVWRRRQLAIAVALTTATLLVCDAWFDVMLSWGTGDFALSLCLAVAGELPLAGLFVFVAGRLLRLTVHAVWVRDGHEGPVPPLWRLRIFTLTEPEEKR